MLFPCADRTRLILSRLGEYHTDRVPVRIHDHYPSARASHAVKLGQCQIDVANIFQYLRRYDCVKILRREGELRSVSSMEFDPWLVNAMRSSHREQRLADIHAMDRA